MEVRLIDANALLDSMCCFDGEMQCDAEDCIRYKERKYIEAAPTIEAKPIQHGRWIFVGEETMHDGWTYRKHKCSECDFVTVEAKNFCQNCGAEMCRGTENG